MSGISGSRVESNAGIDGVRRPAALQRECEPAVHSGGASDTGEPIRKAMPARVAKAPAIVTLESGL